MNVYFLDWTKPPTVKCLTVQLTVYYRLDNPFHLKKVNDFNLRYGFVRAVRDAKYPNALWLTSEVGFGAGMTPKIFEGWLGMFRRQNTALRRFMGFRL